MSLCQRTNLAHDRKSGLLFSKKGKENTVIQEYVLPDYTHIKRGYVKLPGQAASKSKGTEQVLYSPNTCSTQRSI